MAWRLWTQLVIRFVVFYFLNVIALDVLCFGGTYLWYIRMCCVHWLYQPTPGEGCWYQWRTQDFRKGWAQFCRWAPYPEKAPLLDISGGPRPISGALDRSQRALNRSEGALERSQRALDRSQRALDRSQRALDRSQRALDRSQRALDRSQSLINIMATVLHVTNDFQVVEITIGTIPRISWKLCPHEPQKSLRGGGGGTCPCAPPLCAPLAGITTAKVFLISRMFDRHDISLPLF